MIQSVQLSNFKNFRQQLIDFDRLTVIVGANASGKTSVLEALHLAVRSAVPATTRDQGLRTNQFHRPLPQNYEGPRTLDQGPISD